MTTQRTNTQCRTFVFDLEARAADDAIPVVVSTDAVVEVLDGPEVLVHTPEAVDLRRAPLPIIATHRGNQLNVGIIDDLSISGGKLRGMARFGARQEAAEYKADVLNRIIRSVSAGYVRIKAKVRADGVLVTSRWMPTHAAMVAEPADIGAGFFRSLEVVPAFELEPADPDFSAAPAAQPKESKLDQATQAAAGAIAEQENVQTRGLPAQPAGTTGNRALELENARQRGITNLCKANSIPEATRNMWISSGSDFDTVSEELLQILESRAKSTPKITELGLSEGEAKRFSLFKAVRAASSKGNWAEAGFELECSREIAKRLQRIPEENKFFVPFEVQGVRSAGQRRSLSGWTDAQRRDLTSGTANAGGYLVGTENMSFIEMLRNRSVAYRMGARRLSGLQGNITVPRQTAAATAVWLANEGSTATESQQTFGQMALSPKTVGAYTEISRQLLLQSSPDAEGLTTADLGSVCALAVDVGVLRGTGASGEPTGIVNTAGIGSVTGTSIAYAGILEFQTDVATANVMPAAGGYVTTPAVAALAMQRVKFSSTASPLWEGNVWDGSMAGFPAMSTNQMTAASMLFGDWSQVVVAEWGVLEIEVNPYANFQAGIIGIRAMVSVDVGLRYAAAFSLASSIT